MILWCFFQLVMMEMMRHWKRKKMDFQCVAEIAISLLKFGRCRSATFPVFVGFTRGMFCNVLQTTIRRLVVIYLVGGFKHFWFSMHWE
jgi:hypothetical protein